MSYRRYIHDDRYSKARHELVPVLDHIMNKGSGKHDILCLPTHPVTQKALGLRDIVYGATVGAGVIPPLTGVTNRVWLLPYSILPNPFPKNYFGRPCPVVPRHGFVESRPIKSEAEAKALLAEAREQDPNAEVILMPKLSAKYSGVATNAGVSWALGNDGVTSGTSEVVSLPTPMTSSKYWNRVTGRYMSSRTSDSITDTAYVELVENNGRVAAVQYRNGPTQPTTQNYIPKRTVVKKVIYSDLDSLIKWEKQLQAVPEEDRASTVIRLYGHALSSHYAVHGIELGFPVITNNSDLQVGVGCELIPEANSVKPMTKRELKTLAKGIVSWINTDFIKYERLTLTTAVATVHAMSQWNSDPHLLNFRAMALVTLCRFMASACVGEVRHWYANGPGRLWGAKKPKTIISNVIGTELDPDQDGRSIVYHHMLRPHSLRQMRRAFESTYADFKTRGWSGECLDRDLETQSDSSFGGKNWAKVSEAGLRLAKAIQNFIKHPTPLKWQQVVLAANNAVHTVHNGGHTVNKWMPTSDLRHIAVAPGYGLMNNVAAELALGIIKPKERCSE